MPELLGAHFALHLRYTKLPERRRKLGTRPADQGRPVRIHIALQRRLLDKPGNDRGCGFEVSVHHFLCRQTTVTANIRVAGPECHGSDDVKRLPKDIEWSSATLPSLPSGLIYAVVVQTPPLPLVGGVGGGGREGRQSIATTSRPPPRPSHRR